MKIIILGVSGSIAAYKAADVASTLKKHGCDVHACMTDNGSKFITPLTMQTITKNKVHTGPLSEDGHKEIQHIDLAKKADLFLVAPATANIIAKLAHGLADDMLTTLALAVKDIPLLIAPAMNTRMYENAVVRENLKKLKARGWKEIPPKDDLLACGDTGKGALADVDVIVKTVLNSLK